MERRFLQEYPIDFKPVLFQRHVDDTFLLFKSDSHFYNNNNNFRVYTRFDT